MPSARFPKIHWSFSTLGCPELDLESALGLARRFAMKWVELRALGGTVDLPTWLATHAGTPAAFASLVCGSGLAIASIDTSFRLIGADEAARSALLAHLPWAEALGGVPLRVFDGGAQLDDDTLGQARATMAWWDEKRRESGWRSTWIVETHDSMLDLVSIERVMGEAPESVGLLWDAHHTWKKGGEDVLSTWNAVRRHVRHIHVKDSVSVPSARHPYTYVDLGAGEFPLHGLLERLSADGFEGPVSLEWERMWHPSLAPLEVALQRAAENGWL